MKTQLIKLFITAIAVGLAGQAAAQTVPALVNYQGRLANPDGSALATSDYTLTFRVYDSATNGSGLIWGPQIFDGVAGQGHGGKIPVVQGYFNVMLGPVDTNGVSLDTAFNATNRYVEIRVGTNNPILPHQQILSAPFAFNSAKLAGYDWSTVFGGTNDPVNGKIPGSKIQAGTITSNQLSVTQLPANVALLNANETFSGNVSFASVAGISGASISNGLPVYVNSNGQLGSQTARQVGTSVGIGGLSFADATNGWSTSANSYVDVPGLSVTNVTTGRPVLLALTAGTNSANGCFIESDGTGPEIVLHFVVNGVAQVDLVVLGAASSFRVPASIFQQVCFPGPGTNVFSVQVNNIPGSTSTILKNVRLIAFEL